MTMLRTLLVVCAVCVVNGSYTFFRSMKTAGTRRMFGGTEVRLGAWPRACALLDYGQNTRCSCAVLAPRWAITAAHCALPVIAYVQYNGLELAESDLARVDMLYQHPEYQVVMKQVDNLTDIVMLHHDVGLARTGSDMRLRVGEHWLRSMPIPIASIAQYDVSELKGREVEVLGFGTTDEKPIARHLHRVQLVVQGCDREGWLYCACAMGAERGVCAGDSGGPVLYNGTQIGVTSLGPLSCGGLTANPPMSRSVFTVLQPYTDVINATLDATPGALRMREVRRSDARRMRLSVVLWCAGVPSYVNFNE